MISCMGKKKSVLWDLIFESYGVQIAISLVLVIAFGLQIVAWVLGFIPPEYQTTVFLLLCSIAGITIAVVLYAIVEAPSFIMSFFRGR